MHKDKIVGFISNKDGNEQELQEFGTFTCQLHQIKEWLLKNKVRHCLMESTGNYWISLYMILTEAGINVTVANPVHIKQLSPISSIQTRNMQYIRFEANQ